MTRPSGIDPRCCCCGNAYGTRYLCATCRADPANDGWSEAPEEEVAWEAPPYDDRGILRLEGDAPTVRVWNPTDAQRTILRLALEGGTPKAIATLTGSSVQYVRRVLNDFKLKPNRKKGRS